MRLKPAKTHRTRQRHIRIFLAALNKLPRNIQFDSDLDLRLRLGEIGALRAVEVCHLYHAIVYDVDETYSDSKQRIRLIVPNGHTRFGLPDLSEWHCAPFFGLWEFRRECGVIDSWSFPRRVPHVTLRLLEASYT